MPDLLADRAVAWAWLVLATEVLALLSIPSVLLHRRGKPVSALSWILAMVGIPLLGLLAWWLIGCRHLVRKRRKRQAASDTVAVRLTSLRDALDLPARDLKGLLPIRQIPEDLADAVFPATGDNHVELLESGGEAFEVLASWIAAAREHIHLLFYIWRDDRTGQRFRDLLIERARAGVQVRLLYDTWGSPGLSRAFVRSLTEAGVQVAPFGRLRLLTRSPAINFRNHRKLVVIDGRRAVTGGFNIGDEYETRWRDLGVALTGPVVDQFQEVFCDDWYFTTGEDLVDPAYFGRWRERAGDADGPDGPPADCALIASGPDTHQSAMHDALFIAINQTRMRLWIITPYLVPGAALLTALRTAVYRGVDVRVMVPATSDVRLVRMASRSFYPDLLAWGVRIHEYQPAMLHAKAALFDDRLALIGSANLDNRSFRLNFEASCYIGCPRLNRQLAVYFELLAADSETVDAAQLARRGRGGLLLDAAANLLSPLL